MRKNLQSVQRGLRSAVAVLAVAFLCGLGFQTHGAEGPSLENKVKAACLYQFAANTEWPAGTFANPSAPLVIGLLGDVPFADDLERGLQNKTAQGRKLAVRRLASAENLEGCHVLFVSPSQEGRIDALLQQLAGRPILIVGEAERFAQRGGAINFVKQDGNVKFEVNTDAVARARLKLGSQVLKLALLVKDGSPPR